LRLAESAVPVAVVAAVVALERLEVAAEA